ncbi:NADPH quinone reductase [Aspergillus flavus]|uniref:NADPH quinone reductase n=1 Tax=Aspergillus flavus (strain ATCC 200026 / FGSC A1120 / IAM 13836 / NRRL 3357 / JCM 12722 / SRRC 167) TaxID=332952 RepID=A0A7U2QR13_ASPFN|nr:NADPH quinone reductase [Aspergillus flavus]
MKQWQVKLARGADFLQPTNITTAQLGEYRGPSRFHAASLNCRDIMIGTYFWDTKHGIVDEVVKSKPKVTRSVIGHLVSPIFHLIHHAGSLGSTYDGVVRQYAFNEQACVEIPSNLSYREAAALPCAVVTAWNALYKGPIKCCRSTGGINIFALQFANMGGTQVIATTGNAEKAAKLKAEGADHVITYKEDPRYGGTAKEVSDRGPWADFVTEIVTIDGQIAVIGSRADVQESPYAGLHTTSTMIIRGVLVGSRQLNDAINTAIKINNLHPVIESRV